MEWLLVFEKLIWFGFAAIGFAILFNVPVRALLWVFGMGAVGGIFKVVLMKFGINIIFATLIGATIIGILSVYAAHIKHCPPLIFSIPAVIPMVPGAFAYRMMLGFIQLSGKPGISYGQVLETTVNNGLKTFFILICLAAGVAFPMLLTRKESVKEFRLLQYKPKK
jgi:uncharacterized membrane protein YjjB (DUF3815 family)